MTLETGAPGNRLSRPASGEVNETLVSFLDRLAGGEPAPGGGAASALGGAAAAALVAMACRVTARHTPSEAIVAASKRAELLRQQLMTLMRDDVEAYQAVLTARRAPSERGSLVQDAMQRATSVPLGTARAAAGILDLCASICDVVRVSTVGDLAVAVALAGAALDAASLTARINLKEIADKDFVRAVWQGLQHLEPTAAVRESLAQRIARRTGLDRAGAGTLE